MICNLTLQAQSYDPRYIKPPPERDPDQVRADQFIQAMRDNAEANRMKAEADEASTHFLMGFFAFILVAASCVWVIRDARKNRVPCIGDEYNEEKDPKVWAVVCFLFCPAFLYYAYRRTKSLESKNLSTVPEKRDKTASAKTDESIVETPVSIPGTMESQLEEFKALHEKGLITEAEFQEKRHKILGI